MSRRRQRSSSTRILAASEPNFYAFIHAVDFIMLGIVLSVVVGIGWLLWRLVRFVLAFLAYQTTRYQKAARRRGSFRSGGVVGVENLTRWRLLMAGEPADG